MPPLSSKQGCWLVFGRPIAARPLRPVRPLAAAPFRSKRMPATVVRVMLAEASVVKLISSWGGAVAARPRTAIVMGWRGPRMQL